PVALASTGGSWMPVFELLEARGFQGLLMEPRQATRVPGRPHTDRLAGKGRQRLPTYGRLAGALRPEAHVCGLRSALRHRQRLLPSAAHHRQPRHQAWAQMHRTRTQGGSASPGVTGMAILAGERDPQRLATLRHPHGPHAEEDSAQALQGPWRAAHLLAFQPARALSAFSHQQMPQGAQQLTAPRATCDDPSAGRPLPPTARRHTKTNAPRCEARPPLSRLAGVALTTLAGSDEGTAVVLRSASGTDRHRWPSVQHFWSWRGWCPQHTRAGGQVLARRVRPGAPRVPVALRRAARTLPHAQRALGAFVRRRKARLGTPQAITATAHPLARLGESRWQHGSASGPQGLDTDEAQSRARQGTTRAKQAKACG